MIPLKELLNTYVFTDTLSQIATFEIREEIRTLGTMTVGGFQNGSTVLNTDEGMYISHPDGVRHFINWSWFD